MTWRWQLPGEEDTFQQGVPGIFNLAGRSLPGWLTGDIWIVLVGRLGWDLNRSLSSVDTGVRKWFWFHPSCWDREENRLLEKQTLTRQNHINGFFSVNIYSGGKVFRDGMKASLPADNKNQNLLAPF